DQINYSCAYDAMFGPLYDVWQAHGPKWTDQFDILSNYAAVLARGFQAFKSKTGKLEDARDDVRAVLNNANPENFPYGAEWTAIDDLALEIFGGTDRGTVTTKCTGCDHLALQENGFNGAQTIVSNKRLKTKYKNTYCVSHWLNGQRIRKTNQSCPNCGNGMVTITTLDDVPPCFYLSVSDNNILFDSAVSLTVGETRYRYALRGVIYSGANHFTSRIIKPNGAVWYHDGIETGRNSVEEGSV
ncbi:hypothetical protein B0H17DRAFT_871458, partial [Mycena rosella]